MAPPHSTFVLDTDGHVVEPDEMWREYLPRRLWPAAPRWVTDNEGRTRRLIGGRLQPFIPFPERQHYHGDTTKGVSDPAARVAEMGAHGISLSTVTPSAGLHFGAIPETDVQAALCRAYNDWVAEFCAYDADSLQWVAVVPQSDICALVEEADRALNELGAKGVVLRPNPIGGRTFDNPAFDPLWELLEGTDRPLLVHEATTMNVPEAGTDRFTNYLYLHVVSQPHEHQMACLALVCGGVFERHARLRVAFTEKGAGWVPYWLERMDQHVRYWGHASRPLPELPSHYFLRQCFVSPFADEAMLPQVIECIGDANLVFSSDYPFPYTTSTRIADALLTRDDLSSASKARIAGGNGRRLFGL
jgi:uncharacterized protein